MNNKTVALSVSVLLLLLLPSFPLRADPGNTGEVIEALQDMQANARAVKHNAGIYQWKRVALEVERIAFSDAKVQKNFAANASAKKLEESLHLAILVLRSASVSHNVDRTSQAADMTKDACITLTKLLEKK